MTTFHASSGYVTALPPAGEPAGTTGSLQRAQQRRRAWVRECAFIAGSYAVNGSLLGLFGLSGTAPWAAGVLYAVPGILLSALVAQLVAGGHTGRFADPSLAVVHNLGSATLCLVGAALHPQLAFAYALILFTLVLTATYRVPKRQMQLMLVVVVVLFAAVTLGRGHSLRIPAATEGERLASWAFFVMTLGRCVMLSVINTHNNRLLRQRSDAMKSKLAEIERLAHHDELTGTLNRRRLLHFLDEELARHGRSHEPVSVAMLDLDHFKAVNDTLGHLAGDEVLRRFATAVQSQTRSTDRFGRYGGEEFLVILAGAEPDTAIQAVERARAKVAAIDWSDIAPELRVTFSAGVATYNGHETVELLISRADLSLYEAKRDGRNCTRAL